MNNKSITIGHNPHSVMQNIKHSSIHLFHLGNTWLDRQKTRRQLAQLPSYLLRDIGLTEADRYQESKKHFWEN